MMQTGKLDQRVIIQALTVTQNDLGESLQSYATLATVWGHVMSQRGQEAFEAARVNARETIRVQVRYRDDVTLKHRIQWQSQTYNIIALDRSSRRDGYLWLTAEVNGAV